MISYANILTNLANYIICTSPDDIKSKCFIYQDADLQPHPLPVLAGSLPIFLLKQFHKIVGIQDPHLLADLADGEPGVGQIPGSLTHADPGEAGRGSVVVDDPAVFADEPLVFFIDLLDGGSVSYDGGRQSGVFYGMPQVLVIKSDKAVRIL